MEQSWEKTKFCKFCGEKIAEDAVVCRYCGRQVEELKGSKLDNIIINNSSSASAAASATNSNGRIKRKYNHFLDFILICCTCGLWLFWMAIRPKYE